MRRLRWIVPVVVLLALATALSQSRAAIRLGALYPLTGPLAHYGNEELRGVKIAVQMINVRGGVDKHIVTLDVADAPDVAAGWKQSYRLAKKGVPVILGTYSSTIALAGSEAAHRNKVIWWETGAVADLVTSRGYPEVFRLGPSGATLSAQAAGFATEVLAPRFKIAPHALKLAVVYEDDPYGSSVGAGIHAQAAAKGFRLVGSYPYDPAIETFTGIMRSLRAAKPDVVVIASYLHDGARFREALVASKLPVKAVIGKCAAFFTPEMAKLLGAKIDGVFVADKPMEIAPAALTDSGRALETEFRTRFQRTFGRAPEAAAYMGFSGAWALVGQTLPKAAHFTAKDIADAARSLDLPDGSLPNGSGVRFAPVGDPLAGQNTRAFGVVWQWQGGRPVLVWPRIAARGEPVLSSR
ncbi:MAG: ABC transporter substrate-binding protein [Actinomycetota bacterium]